MKIFKYFSIMKTKNYKKKLKIMKFNEKKITKTLNNL